MHSCSLEAKRAKKLSSLMHFSRWLLRTARCSCGVLQSQRNGANADRGWGGRGASALAGMTALERLTLSDTLVMDAGMRALGNLRRLTALDVSYSGTLFLCKGRLCSSMTACNPGG